MLFKTQAGSDITAALLPGLQRALRDWLHGKAERSHLWATASLETELPNTGNKKWALFRQLYKSSHFMVEITSCTGCLWCEQLIQMNKALCSSPWFQPLSLFLFFSVCVSFIYKHSFLSDCFIGLMSLSRLFTALIQHQMHTVTSTTKWD